MARYTRHQLKQDKFAEAAADTVSWVAAHQQKLVTATIVAAVVLVIGVGGWFYLEQRDQEASLALGKAVRIQEAPLRNPKAPVQPGFVTFPTAAERAKAAQKEFQAVADKFPYTRSAEVARYFVAVTARDAGDTATAERQLKEIAASRNPDLAPLAKFALASLYRTTKRTAEAIQIYKELIERPSGSVPKATAQLELASVYEADQPAEAIRIYQQVKTENPQGPAGEIAASRLGAAR